MIPPREDIEAAALKGCAAGALVLIVLALSLAAAIAQLLRWILE